MTRTPAGNVKPGRPWIERPDGTLTIRFRLTPKASRDHIGAVVATADGPAIQAHVRAAPEAGAANRALTELAARWLGVPKTCLRLTAGAKSRIKTLALDTTPAAVKRLEALPPQERTAKP